ncbi:MAG: Release factor glutamine methyltransferase [Pelotomaculum sp. PtaU1.Bin035]|nr:MAG: Release factor glutamine methyltransferase [Pelotomaculum sp. PtaU1.Bin035]
MSDLAVTVKEALSRARKRLMDGGADSPALDAEVLLAYVTGLDRAGLYRDLANVLAPGEEAVFSALVARRRAGEPVAYLTGRKEFMGLEFIVNRFVLIPRPETELLVEAAARLSPAPSLIVDVGTGSGAIAVSLAVLVPEAVVYATDRSFEAIETARLNAYLHGAGQRVLFFQGDLLAPLSGLDLAGRVDLVTANLPYIPTKDLPALPRDVRLFEPPSALDGGADGLDLYRRLIPMAAGILKPGGTLLMEIGCGQREAAAGLLQPPLREAAVLKDLAGRDRMVIGSKTSGG